MQFNFVRRLDELGRIVIPKEMRSKLNFSSGDLLDLVINNDTIIISKCNSTLNKNYILEILNLVEYLSDVDIVITDNNHVIAKGSKIDNKILECKISGDLKNLLIERKNYESSKGICIGNDYYLEGKVFVKVLIKDSNVLGLLIMKFKDTDKDINLFINMVARLLLQ